MSTMSMEAQLFLKPGTRNESGWPLILHSNLKTAYSNTMAMRSRRRTVSRRRMIVRAAAVVEKNESTEPVETPVRMVAIVGEGSISPLKSTPWEEVMLHTAKRLKWIDEGYELHVFVDSLCNATHQNTEKIQMVHNVDILVVVAVTSKDSVAWIQTNCENIENIICFDSAVELTNKLGGLVFPSEIKRNILRNIFGNYQLLEKRKKSEEVVQSVFEAWDRRNSDDIRFCLLVIINAYIKPVPILQNLRSEGFSTLNSMIKNCGRQILNCLMDPKCRKALQCMSQCNPVDQVCNYRCIASYESPNLEALSLCVLEKNNCLELDAKVPEKPFVPPMQIFRGKNMCHETAEDLFVGWLGSLEWSWRVAAGLNPAYAQFPCQYQLFYRGNAKGSFWYVPVFMVKTLEGEMVWRRRRYRVKRGKTAGTFLFSVLDNGVVLNEFWSIVDVCDDLSWGLFHYNGAARAAGQSYTGAVLVSPDGAYPEDPYKKERISAALEKCGIKEWELLAVDNCSCSNPPLGIPIGSTLHYVIQTNRK